MPAFSSRRVPRFSAFFQSSLSLFYMRQSNLYIKELRMRWTLQYNQMVHLTENRVLASLILLYYNAPALLIINEPDED